MSLKIFTLISFICVAQSLSGMESMKYIGIDQNGIYVIKDYLDYINDNSFSDDITNLLSKERWDIHSPTSLHDSNISNISFNIDWGGDGYSIELKLIGAMNDRIFKLSYLGVIESDLSDITRYGDLLIHELYEEHEVYIHQIIFDDAPIVIKARKIKFEEKMLSGSLL